MRTGVLRAEGHRVCNLVSNGSEQQLLCLREWVGQGGKREEEGHEKADTWKSQGRVRLFEFYGQLFGVYEMISNKKSEKKMDPAQPSNV